MPWSGALAAAPVPEASSLVAPSSAAGTAAAGARPKDATVSSASAGAALAATEVGRRVRAGVRARDMVVAEVVVAVCVRLVVAGYPVVEVEVTVRRT